MSSRPMNQTPCSIADCERLARKRGWCQKHYARWRSTGDPLGMRQTWKSAPPASVRFFRRIKVDPLSGCWLWQLKPTTQGYAYFHDDEQKRVSVHRFAYQLLKGPIPAGKQVDHECHNRDKSCPGGSPCIHRRCSNPSHLVLTSLGDNVLRGVGITAQNARKTHCKRGHPLSGENVLYATKGPNRRLVRLCRTCRREFMHEYRKKRKREKARANR